MDPKIAVALTLSLVGGLSTSLGALLAILNHAPNNRTLGILQGFATGLMLSMSFFDLAYDAINAIGFLKGNLWLLRRCYLEPIGPDEDKKPVLSWDDCKCPPHVGVRTAAFRSCWIFFWVL
ncbi:zinc transporter ZTP29-like isoform X2 [Brachypodium distachyon]|uniref:Uncharacterized protein n=1 Tax=Brachypodium distachyon TaxID=15368 RepID=A0A2K2CTI9_BRADI|nr:zinc transporter ZTP29-like isoform X2 [Brachypodium distachyon]XP_024311128.1 zinc transporter ZTP29-like isoform X2 [Brachypodium distachyon]XP_024311129.1 zinc transporter ZTP29-like isoform X2 [Brachypodium distachyon]XP_024311130.1 zinc transporter ZTP29-like isoform X2 [Brachypodium distachyon]PNT65344.1 hypothetical protein BRADI_4g40910v3 [Brachypodium distachyon]|eukprot:XP_024311127.1 zinc transporter ZTP29-like isoform X2 [Brachypodium distachyon]